jgi:hypothetical protein
MQEKVYRESQPKKQREGINFDAVIWRQVNIYATTPMLHQVREKDKRNSLLYS